MTLAEVPTLPARGEVVLPHFVGKVWPGDCFNSRCLNYPTVPMRLPCRSQRAARLRAQAFTIVEALVSIAVLMIFAVTSTMTLNFFDERASRNRNAEAARAVVEDYVNALLADPAAPAATAAGTDLDGDGNPDGVVCTTMLGRGDVPASIPLVVTRAATPSSVVNGVLYWRVQAVGTRYGCTADADLVQVNFTLQYTYRNQTFYYKAMTFKAKPDV